MPPKLELTGRRFGQLVALQCDGKNSWGAWMWRCECACGRESVVRGSILTSGRTRSCASCASTRANTTHGATGTPLYQRWRAMIGRTCNPNHKGYANYGGRGITVCERWLRFEAFAEDMGPTFTPDLELDRTDVNEGYSSSNCRWLTHAGQQRNKRTNHLVTYGQRTCSVQEWAELLGVKPNTIITRLRRDWPIERALGKGIPPDVLLAISNGGAE